MARVPDEFIQDVLARTDMVSVVRQYVPSLKKSGTSYMGLCPFHEEKTPSFSIDPAKNLYHCFGCGAGGNTIGFVMRKAGMTYIDTVHELATRAGLDMPQQEGFDDKGRQQLYDVLEKASSYYQQKLQSEAGKEARQYLQQRGIDEATARHFELGYAPPGWDNLKKNLKADSKTLLQAALTKQGQRGRGEYDVFRDRVVFPIRSHVRGRVVAFGGRVLNDDDKPKYLNSPESEVFAKRREWYGLHLQKTVKKRPDRVFVVEGYMDVVSMAAHGLPEAVASLGTSVSAEQLQALFRFFPAVVFCFDGDSAGRTAAERTLDNLLPLLHAKVDISFMFLPEGEDPDSMVRKDGADALRQHSTTGVLDFLRQQIRGGNIAPEGTDARARLVSEARDRLTSLKDPIIRSMVLENMAQDFAMQTEVIEKLLQPTEDTRTANTTDKSDSSRPLMSYAITLLLHEPAMIKEYKDQVKTLPEVQEKQFFAEWLQVVEQNPEIPGGTMLEHWRGTRYSDRLQELAATPILLKENNAIKREFSDTWNRLQLILCKKRIQALLKKGIEQLTEDQAQELRKLRGRVSKVKQTNQP